MPAFDYRDEVRMSKRERPLRREENLAPERQFRVDGHPAHREPEMATLRCPACQRSLYMALRTVHSPSWRCPECGTKIRPFTDEFVATDTR